MKTVLVVSLICFFVLISIWLLIVIVQGICYIVYQKTDKIYLSPSACCCASGLYFSLQHQGKHIDTAFAYTKHRGCRYVLGLNGIYKIGINRFEKLCESDMLPEELAIMNQMSAECHARVQKDQELLTHFLLRYTAEGDSAS